MACLSKIRTALENMTTSERKLGQLILKDPELVLNGSTKTIGENCGISAASVVRFAQMLGFSSLSAMKDDLRADLEQSKASEPVMQLKETDSLEVLAKQFVCGVSSGIQTMLDMQSFPDLERAVDMICEAKTVYLYGGIASSYPARDLQQKLVRARKRAVYREDRTLGEMDVYSMTEEDLMIVFSCSGTYAGVNKAVQIAASRGLKCLAITRFGRTPLASMATLILPLPENNDDLMHYRIAQSKYASMMISDMLFAGYALKSGLDLNEILPPISAVLGK